MLETGLKKMREDASSLRGGLERQITEYIRELDRTYSQLKNEALELLDKIKPSVRDDVRAAKVHRGAQGKKPEDYSLIMGIIDAIDGTLSAKTIAERWRARYPDWIVPDRAIRRILSRLAKQTDSPLELVKRGTGTEPNVYRKKRAAPLKE